MERGKLIVQWNSLAQRQGEENNQRMLLRGMTRTSAIWQYPTNTLDLTRDDVHIWRVALLVEEEDVEQLAKLLSTEECERAKRFRFDRHRRRFIVARAVLRQILGSYLAMSPEAIEFYTAQHGKPYIMHLLRGTELCFNVSHSHEMAVFAITRDRRLGVDVEHIRPITNIHRIAQHFFSKREAETLKSLPSAQQPIGFLNCWTRKEAYIKAIGSGLSHPLDSFDVTLRPSEPAKLLCIADDPIAHLQWKMQAFIPAPDYIAAIAVEDRDWHPTFWDFKHRTFQ